MSVDSKFDAYEYMKGQKEQENKSKPKVDQQEIDKRILEIKARHAEMDKEYRAKYGEGPLAAGADCTAQPPASPKVTKPEIVAEEESFKIDSNLTAKAYSVEFMD